MATVTGLTAARMAEIEAASVVAGEVVGQDLILIRNDESTINAGTIVGPAGPPGESFQHLAAAPADPVEGQIYYDTVADGLYVYANSAWARMDIDTTALHKTTSGEVNALTAKATPTISDKLLIEDAAASWVKKSITIGALFTQMFGVTGTIGDLTAIDSTGVALDDVLLVEDISAGGTHKKITTDNLIRGVFTKLNSSFDVNGQRLTNLGAPSSGNDAATKAYVDATSQGLTMKAAVKVATTTNGTLASAFANGQTVDGVTLTTGDRILIKNQTAGAENGIYTVNASGAPTRATDFDVSSEVVTGSFVYVSVGTTNAQSGWVLSTANPLTLDTTPLTFIQFSGAGQITAGAGMTKTGNTLNVGAGTGITVNADDIAVDTTSVVRKYAANCLGSATVQTFTHNLGTQDVTVSVYRIASPYDEVECDVKHHSTSQVRVEFAVAPSADEYRIVVHG